MDSKEYEEYVRQLKEKILKKELTVSNLFSKKSTSLRSLRKDQNQILSKREKQVLKLLLAEYNQQEICKELDLHANTVSCCKQRIMKKMGAKTMVGIVKECFRRGYLKIEDD
jgi:DNA-binding NarL/FixJ family response regulator